MLKLNREFWSFCSSSLSSCSVMSVPSPVRGIPAEQIHRVSGLKGVPLGFTAGLRQCGTNNASSVRLCPWQRAHIVGSPVSVPPGEIPSTRNLQALPQGHSQLQEPGIGHWLLPEHRAGGTRDLQGWWGQGNANLYFNIFVVLKCPSSASRVMLEDFDLKQILLLEVKDNPLEELVVKPPAGWCG